MEKDKCLVLKSCTSTKQDLHNTKSDMNKTSRLVKAGRVYTKNTKQKMNLFNKQMRKVFQSIFLGVGHLQEVHTS